MTFEIRAYKPGDEEKILEMFNEVFQQSREMAHWNWKYRDNPYGSHCISLAVAQDGCLAAHYAGYPVKICCHLFGAPTEIDCFQLGDKMTRKEFRSVGLGRSALISRAYRHFKQTYLKGDAFTYGFAAHHSFRFGTMVLKYADIEPVPYRSIPIDSLRNIKISRLKRLLSKTKAEEVSSFDDSWTDFFRQVSPHYKFLVKKDAAYLKWRYLERPDRKYLILAVRGGSELAGWAIFHREGTKIVWGDGLFKPDAADLVKEALRTLAIHPAAAGADSVECWFPPRPLWWHRVLEKIGFQMSEEANGLHFVSPAFNDDKTPELLKNHFYYCIGDSDLF